MNNQQLYELVSTSNYKGFKLTKRHFIKELQCYMWILKHPASGLEMAYIANDSREKTFSLSFKLCPSDDTGVAHIIEHAILNGSRKYKVKNWGGDGLLCSFYGAFTMRDSSMYPVSSDNEVDFQHLVQIYTDAVFDPQLQDNEYSLMQEGWHYTYDEENDVLHYNGVVLNEMKAAYDMPEFLLSDAQISSAFQDTFLANNVGGAPEAIPSLTYDHFINTYRNFFAPENCLAYVYGETCLSDVLDTLEPYIAKYTPTNKSCHLTITPSINEHIFEYDYPLTEKKANDAYVGINYAFDGSKEALLAFDLLASMLEKHLKESLPAMNISVTTFLDMLYPIASITCKNCAADTAAQTITLIEKSVNDFLSKRISPDEVTSAIWTMKFKRNEKINFVPVGVDFGIKVTSSWSHNLDCWSSLEYEDVYDSLSTKSSSYFEDLFKKTFLDNPYKSKFLLKGNTQLQRIRMDAEQGKLAEVRKNMSLEELEAIKKKDDDLVAHLNAPEKSEDLTALPKTKVEDLAKDAPHFYPEKIETSKNTLYFVESDSNTIRLTLHFTQQPLREGQISMLGIIRDVFNYTAPQKSKYTNKPTMEAVCYGNKNPEKAFLQMQLHCSTLPEHIEMAQEEILRLLTLKDSLSKDLLQKILGSKLAEMNNTNTNVVSRLRSYHSQSAVIEQYFQGPEYKDYIEVILNDYDNLYSALQRNLKMLLEKSFDIDELTIGLSCHKNILDQSINKITLPSKEVLQIPVCSEILKPRDVFTSNGNTQYIAYGGHIEATASAYVSCKLMDEYLVAHLRDLGGAYTARASINAVGDLLLLSCRDPHLGASIELMKNVTEYLRTITAPQLENAIIRTASGLSKCSSVGQNGYVSEDVYDYSMKNFYQNFDNAAQQELWDNIKKVSIDDINQVASRIEEVLNQNLYVALASEKAIKKHNNLFLSIK